VHVIIYGATQSLLQKSGYSHDMTPVKVTFNQVERELRKRNFGILGTLSRKGRSHSVGVLYGVSPPNKSLALYVMTGRDTRKARNIANNPNVSFAIPLPRRLLTFIPPNCIQFQGTAEIIPLEDEGGRQAFSATMILREILKYADKIAEVQNEKICFIRIYPDPVIFTYGLGVSWIELREHLENAASRVEIPAEYR